LGQKVKDIQQYLIDRSKLGDASAQRELYKLYVKNMYNTALRMLAHSAEVEDVIQESFLEAFTKLNDYRGESSFGSWLKRIVVNKCISQIRKRRIDFVDEQDLDVLNTNDELDFNTDDESQVIELIKKGINELAEGYRIVLSLYLLEGYDHVEISEILKISESTSKTQYLRAKNKLKEWLVKHNVRLNYENR
jgi:RNA polymerase sigma factor (sigma-70 family)